MALDCDPTGRRARWALEIDPHDWTIEYRQGRKHANADSMSHRLLTAEDATPMATPRLNITRAVCFTRCYSIKDIMDNSLLNMNRQNFIQAQKADPELQVIMNWVLNDCRPPFSNIKAASLEMRQYWREGGRDQVTLFYRL